MQLSRNSYSENPLEQTRIRRIPTIGVYLKFIFVFVYKRRGDSLYRTNTLNKLLSHRGYLKLISEDITPRTTYHLSVCNCLSESIDRCSNRTLCRVNVVEANNEPCCCCPSPTGPAGTRRRASREHEAHPAH